MMPDVPDPLPDLRVGSGYITLPKMQVGGQSKIYLTNNGDKTNRVIRNHH